MKTAAKTHTEALQEIVEQYREAMAPDKPFNLRDVAGWAIQNGLLQPAKRDLISIVAREIGQAMRAEVIEDPQGRTIRRKYARKEKTRLPDGEMKQITLWDDITTASPEHMQVSFQQCRRGIASDNFQMKQNSESYNENWNPGEPIRLSFNYTEDMEEMSQPTHYEGSEPTEDEDEDL